MKRKIMLVILLVMLFACGMVFSACDDHKHSFSSNWTSDETEHWHECKSCNEIRDLANHTPNIEKATCGEDKVCTVCDKVLEEAKHTPNIEKATCEKDKVCTVCDKVLEVAAGHKPNIAEPTFEKNQVCTVCGEILSINSYWNNCIVVPMPALDGVTDAKLVGGVTLGWQISKNCWGIDGTSDKAKAAVAFVSFMTQPDIINGWCGNQALNPLLEKYYDSTFDMATANLYTISSRLMGMNEEAEVSLYLDAFITHPEINAYRAGTQNLSNATNAIAAIKESSYIHEGYVAGSRGTTAIPTNADITASVTLNVVTSYGPGDWQNGIYNEALADFKAAYPKVTINQNDVVVTNETKSAMHALWTTSANMPDVLAWFSDAQAEVIRDDSHLVSVAAIQAVYGKYAENMQEQFLDRYAVPIVGTFEGMYVNIELLLKYAPADVKEAYNAAATLVEKVSIIRSAVDTWEKLENISDAAVSDGKIAFAQDQLEENNYFIDQMTMVVLGRDKYLNPSSVSDEEYQEVFDKIKEMLDAGWFGDAWEGNHTQAQAKFVEGDAVFMLDGAWARGSLVVREM